MGCGVSKLDVDREPHQGQIHPIICFRFYEFRANRTSTSQNCLVIERKITEALGNVEARRSITASAETQCRSAMENIDDVNFTREQKNAVDDRRRRLSHRSLSFRVYCREAADDILELVEQKDLDECIDADNIVVGQRISTSEESVCSNEVAVTEPSKKVQRMSMIKKMPPKDANTSFSSSSGSSENSPLLQKAVLP